MATKRILGIFLLFLVALSGCIEQERSQPRIVGTVRGLYQGESRTNNDYSKYRTTSRFTGKSTSQSFPSAWHAPSAIERRWKAIVIHHSATDKGSAAIFDKHHKQNNGWDGVGYDFVIGNGTGTGNGQVEVTNRWRQQKTGAHCKTDYSNWANRQAVGICLVGNFNKTGPTWQQMNSLSKLVSFLQTSYNIDRNHIYGHNTTPKHSTKTDCPGKRFSMANLKSKL